MKKKLLILALVALGFSGLLFKNLGVRNAFGDTIGTVDKWFNNGASYIYPRASNGVLVGASAASGANKLQVTGGTTTDTLTVSGIGGSTQCVHANSSGVFSGTGADCGAGGAGGTVTSVTSANADIAVANTTTTPVLTLNSGTGANQILKLDGSQNLTLPGQLNLPSQINFTSNSFTQFQATTANINLDFKTVAGSGTIVFTPNAVDAFQLTNTAAEILKSHNLLMDGATSGAITLQVPAVSGSNTITIPAVTGTLITSADSGTVTGTIIQGSVALAGSPTTTTQAASDNSTKIATTAYVTTGITNAIAGVNPAVAVQAATTGVLPNTPTYSNGVSGIGATLTAGSNAALTVDGYTPALNERLLIKNQASAFQNGVYYISQLGTGILPYILTRALDYNQPSDMNNTGAIPVVNGTVNAQTSWVQTSTVNTVGTDSVTFTQFSLNPTTVFNTAGTGLTGSGNTVSLITPVSVANGGTGISSGTSGGIPYYSGSTTIASSGALSASRLVIGGGAGVAPSVLGLGSAYQIVGTNSGATAVTNLTLAGTSNQVSVGTSGTTITLSTPQNIDTAATPQFARLGLGAAADANALFYGSLGSGQNLLKSVQGSSETSGVNVIDLATTWNNAANTPTAIKLNVTDTASNANSLLMDLQVGGSSKFKVDKGGNITVTSCTGCGGGGSSFGSLTGSTMPGVTALPNIVYKNIQANITATGKTDLYTVPANKRAIFGTITMYNNSGLTVTTFAPYAKVSGTYYRLNANSNVTNGTNGNRGTTGVYVGEAGEIFSVQTDQQPVNVVAYIIEFDNTSNLFTKKVTSFAAAAANNTLYTVGGGHSAYILPSGFNPVPITSQSITCGNESGGTRTYTGNIVLSGGSVASTNQIFNTGVNNNTASNMIPGATMAAGDFINVTTDTNTATQICWVTVIEH